MSRSDHPSSFPDVPFIWILKDKKPVLEIGFPQGSVLVDLTGVDFQTIACKSFWASFS